MTFLIYAKCAIFAVECCGVRLIQVCAKVRVRLRVLDDINMEFENDFSLKEWAKDKPLSILQLDPADRAVLRIAGRYFKKKNKKKTTPAEVGIWLQSFELFC